jgi:hypothetical protein
MPTVGEVAAFQHLLSRLTAGAVRAVERMLGMTPPEQVPDVYPALVDPYLAASAQVSAHWYHSLGRATPFAAQPGPLPPPEQLSQNAHYALSTGNPFGALSMATDRHVFQTSATTIIHNADREHIRYARQARPDACAFCRLLATRSTHLYGEKGVIVDPETGEYKLTVVGRAGRTRGTRAIGELYHDDCHCVAVPIRPGDDYSPPDYVDQWQADYENAQRDDDVHSFDEIVNYMRRAETARTGARATKAAAKAAESAQN